MLQCCYQTSWIDLKTITCKACIIVNYVFGRVDFREDDDDDINNNNNKKEKLRKKFFFRECLVRREGEKKDSETQVLSP